MKNQNTEYQIGNATFTVDRVFSEQNSSCQLITEAIISKSKKNLDFDTPAPPCYNQTVSERFF